MARSRIQKQLNRLARGSRQPPQPKLPDPEYPTGWLTETGKVERKLERKEITPPGSALRGESIKRVETWRNMTTKELEDQMNNNPDAAIREAAAEQWFIDIGAIGAEDFRTSSSTKNLFVKNVEGSPGKTWHIHETEEMRKLAARQASLVKQLEDMKARMGRNGFKYDRKPIEDLKAHYHYDGSDKNARKRMLALAGLPPDPEPETQPTPPYKGPIKNEAPKIAPPAKGTIFCEYCKFFPAAPHKGSIYRESGNHSSNLCEFCRDGEDS